MRSGDYSIQNSIFDAAKIGRNATNLRFRGSKSRTIRNEVVKTVFLITFLLLTCGSALAQSEQPASAGGIEEVYLAKDDGNGKAGEQVTEFRTTDIPIYCVVLLESGAKAVVKMNFVAVNVAGVKTETKVVTASYTTKEGQNRVNFTGRPEGKWTPGKYRVDLFLDGKKVRDVEFDIKRVVENPTAVKYFKPAKTPVKRRNQP